MNTRRTGFSSAVRFTAIICLVAGLTLSLSAQTAPPPTQDATAPNLWYGGIPPTNPTGPVVLFIHGLSANASYWYSNNDMYQMAYSAGYRTAFMSMSADNSNNVTGFNDNGIVINGLFPKVLATYGVTQVYFVGHSEGGLDIEDAIIQSGATLAATKAVFELATPNTGTPLADWVYTTKIGGILGKLLGLETPALQSMQTTNVAKFRTKADPILTKYKIPYFTLEGNVYKDNVTLKVTGAILVHLGFTPNDGLVPVANVPLTYMQDMGVIPVDHFNMGIGSNSFSFIQPRIQGIEAASK